MAALHGLEIDLVQLAHTVFNESDWSTWLGMLMERASTTRIGGLDFFRAVLASSGIDVRTPSGAGDQPLLASAICGANEFLVLAVLESGGNKNVNARISETGGSALHLAAARGYNEVCQVLVTAGGADVNFPDNLGRSPLHTAAINGHLAVVSDLLRLGARVDMPDFAGSLPLHFAAVFGHGLILSALLNSGGDGASGIHATNNSEQTPLFCAVASDHVDAAVRLLEAGADVHLLTLYDNSHMPMLHVAARAGYLEMSRALLSCGADATSISDDGGTALHSAAHIYIPDDVAAYVIDQAEVFRTLLDAGAGVDSRDDYGWTPLHRLCSIPLCFIGSLEVLLHEGADVNASGSNGETPLHVACARLNVNAVKILLDFGADLTAVDDNGITLAEALGTSISPDSEDDGDTLARKHERVRDMLARAPADRAWRRRSWLVMCRRRSISQQHGIGATSTRQSIEGLVSTPPDRGHRKKKAKTNEGDSVGVGGGCDRGEASSASAEPHEEFEESMTAVFGLNEEGIFRTITSFL